MPSADTQRTREFEAEALPHLDALYGLGLRLTGGDESAAQDLVQETMLRAYRAWDSFELGSNCRSWLMTILRNTFINDYRKRKNRPSSVDYDEIAERPVFMDARDKDPEGRFFTRLIDREVISAIEELPTDFRIPLVLADIEGLGYQEIAELLALPLGTVKSRLFRARRRLQRQLYEYAIDMGYIR
jgi:RNA polymerase sigma-70 factor (ECF subfamily)